MSKYVNDLMAYEKWRHDGQPPRKRMKRFAITEISAVDVPAQQSAVATITKRADPSAVERALAATARVTDRLVEKWSRNDTDEALRLAEQGEEMMDEEDPDRAELEAKQEEGRERFLSRPSTQQSMARAAQERAAAARREQEAKVTDEMQRLAQNTAVNTDPAAYQSPKGSGPAPLRGSGLSKETAMTTKNDVQDIEVDEDMAAQAMARVNGCTLGDAYRAIGVARKMGEDAVQKLFTPEVQAALGVTSDRDIQKAAGERAAEIRKSGDRRTKDSSRREALREQLYENPEEFGYQ